MRIDVKKFLFIGSADQKDYFFKRAQEVGIIHFINPNAKTAKDLPNDVNDVTAAIKVLRGLPPIEQEENFALYNADDITAKILKAHQENESLMEEMRVLKLEISRIEIFGNFSLEDIASIEKDAHRKIQFFFGKPSLFQDQPQPEELIYVGSDHGLDYYFAINPEPVSYDKMVEMKFDRSLGQLRARYKAAQKEHQAAEHHLKEYARFNNFLHHALIEKLNKYHLYNAQTYVQQAMEGILFAVEGWVPANKVEQAQALIARMDVYADEVAIEPTDDIPTYLENEGFGRVGEDLVNIYDTPSAKDKDPSMWVLGSFALFFAFIIQDAGYGLIYLLMALYLRYKFPHLKGMGKRMLKLFMVLSIGCIVWGTLMTSFFGMHIPINNPLRKLSLAQWLAEKKIDYHIRHHDEVYQEWIHKHPSLANSEQVQDFVSFQNEKGFYPILAEMTDNIFFELALFIGIVHIIGSLLRYSRRNWQGLGWVAFLIGSYLYFAYYLDTPTLLNYVVGIDLVKGGTIGLEIMIGGIIFAWVGSMIIHGITGVFEIMTIIQVFADILSYLRLYALGLAGMMVAETINEVVGAVPLIVGVLLVIVSHGVNILLSTMSGVIHGLRLNFIEWYHYSFEGSGKQFQPLKLIKRD